MVMDNETKDKTIKAIETQYKGYRFRSRLEARWAIFFDELGVEWEYEKEGFELGEDKIRYLPDFWIKDWDCWVEIKGTEPAEEEIEKCRLLSLGTDKNVLLIYGNCSEDEHRIILFLDQNSKKEYILNCTDGPTMPHYFIDFSLGAHTEANSNELFKINEIVHDLVVDALINNLDIKFKKILKFHSIDEEYICFNFESGDDFHRSIWIKMFKVETGGYSEGVEYDNISKLKFYRVDRFEHTEWRYGDEVSGWLDRSMEHLKKLNNAFKSAKSVRFEFDEKK